MESFMNAATTRLLASNAPMSLAGITSRYQAWRTRRAEIARITTELSSYSERQLCDLGISRSDIPTIAAGQWRRG
jgi:uncharacterized protein YjiS (DUF1127 family)